mgnify:CR=1 FL=1
MGVPSGDGGIHQGVQLPFQGSDAGIITEGDGSRLNLRGGTAKKPVAISKVSGTQQQTFKDKIAAILDMLKDSGISTTVGTIDWYVLQYYAMSYFGGIQLPFSVL